MMMVSRPREQETSGSAGHVSIGVEMVCEILGRLPVKTLMRFKCVSKHWLHLIEHDAYFIDLHRTLSKLRPCFLFAIPLPWNSKFRTKGRHILPRVFSHTCIVGFDPLLYDQCLKPVNGLLCLTSISGITLYNISTREISPLIRTLSPKQKDKRFSIYNPHPVYQFGFDPVTKKHKGVCIWIKYENKASVCSGCEVLTVGENNNSWRIIDERVPDNCQIDGSASVYVNGCVYWITREFMVSQNSEEKVIVAFDLGLEKFRKVIVPKFITDQLLDKEILRGDWYSNRTFCLLEVNEHLALLSRLRGGGIVKLWILDGDTAGSWTELTIDLPFVWDEKCGVEFHAIPGTDEILIGSYGRRKEGSKRIRCLSLHSYNCKNMTLKEEEETSELRSSILEIKHNGDVQGSKCISSAFFESLSPVPKNNSQYGAHPTLHLQL